MANDMNAWIVVKCGHGTPSNDEKFMKKFQLDANAKCFLYETLDSYNFNSISNGSTSKEICDKLDEIYGDKENEKTKEKHCEDQASTSTN